MKNRISYRKGCMVTAVSCHEQACLLFSSIKSVALNVSLPRNQRVFHPA